MQLFSKKGASGAQAPSFRPWHPNFRNTKELPDIKTVRTKFFVNAGCAVLGLASLLYFSYTEYIISDVKQQIAAAEKLIDSNAAPARQAVALYAKFKAEETKAKETVAFVQLQKVSPSDFLYEISQSLPEHVATTSVQLRDSDASIKAVIKASPEQAPAIASTYERVLRESTFIQKHFSGASLTSLARDAASGAFNIEITLTLRK